MFSMPSSSTSLLGRFEKIVQNNLRSEKGHSLFSGFTPMPNGGYRIEDLVKPCNFRERGPAFFPNQTSVIVTGQIRNGAIRRFNILENKLHETENFGVKKNIKAEMCDMVGVLKRDGMRQGLDSFDMELLSYMILVSGFNQVVKDCGFYRDDNFFTLSYDKPMFPDNGDWSKEIRVEKVESNPIYNMEPYIEIETSDITDNRTLLFYHENESKTKLKEIQEKIAEIEAVYHSNFKEDPQLLEIDIFKYEHRYIVVKEKSLEFSVN
ncbi:hypothetical protein HOG98_07665 [bacterium]|jgi:hypothetical protein|nr:hypothetical protein [bacterium]